MGVKVRQKIKGKGQPWWVFIAHNGKRKSISVGKQGAANEVARRIEAQLALGQFNFKEEKPIPTFKEIADSWIDTTVPATCKPSTVREYQDILKNHIEAVFSNQRITDITRGDVKAFLLDKLNAGYAQSTVAHLRNCLSGIFNIALDHEIIQGNPSKQLNISLKAGDRKKDINPLSADELKVLLDTVAEHFPDHYTLFLLLARTGMRIGEALALKWGDIDFNGRFIEVSQSFVRGRISTPKNGKSRSVDMSRQLTAALKAEMLNSKKKGLALGMGEMPETVFTNHKSNMIDKDIWRRRVYNKALQKAGLRKIRIHDLRHTYATLRISKGDNIADVSKQLGHHSVKFTMDVYYHWISGKKKSEVDGLDDPSFQHSPAPYLHPEAKKELTANG